MRRNLDLMEIEPKRVPTKFYISSQNVIKRAAWCKARSKWGQRKWGTVWFSDESKLFTQKSGNHFYFRVKNDDRLPEIEQKAMFHRGLEIMVWGYITKEGAGSLIWVDHRLDQNGYLEILQENLNLEEIKEVKGIWQQDNAPPHISSIKWLENQGVDVLEWPAQSPDLNPIENVWAKIKHELWKKRDQITSKNDVWRLVKEIWFGEDIRKMIPKLYNSMPKRITQCLERNGSHTKY